MLRDVPVASGSCAGWCKRALWCGLDVLRNETLINRFEIVIILLLGLVSSRDWTVPVTSRLCFWAYPLEKRF